MILGKMKTWLDSLYVSGPFGRVFVNCDDPITRRRFTAGTNSDILSSTASEWAASFVWGFPPTVIEVEDNEAATMERQANRFAAELLMPAEVCRAGRSVQGSVSRLSVDGVRVHLSSELRSQPGGGARYRLGPRDWGYAMSEDIVLRRFFRSHAGAAVGIYPTSRNLIPRLRRREAWSGALNSRLKRGNQ